MNRDRAKLPEATVQLQQQLEQWRATTREGKTARIVLAIGSGVGQAARAESHGEGAAAGLHPAQEKSFWIVQPVKTASASGVRRAC